MNREESEALWERLRELEERLRRLEAGAGPVGYVAWPYCPSCGRYVVGPHQCVVPRG